MAASERGHTRCADDRCIPSRTEPELRDMLISYGRHHERSDRFMRHLDRVKLLQSMPEVCLTLYSKSNNPPSHSASRVLTYFTFELSFINFVSLVRFHML
jgi:hypothetical protein